MNKMALYYVYVYKIVYLSFLCFFICSQDVEAASLEEQSMRYLVMGDWGGLPDFPYKTPIESAVAKQMSAIAEALDIQFVVTLGDNFYFDGVKDVEDARFTETYRHVYTYPSLHVPWYFIAGNHDHNGNVTAQIEYSHREKHWNFPYYYYLIKMSVPGTSLTTDILMLDTVQLCGNSDHDFTGQAPKGPENVTLAEKQWRWIEDTLAKSRAEYLVVAGHYPVWSVAEHGPTQTLVDRLRPMLHKYRATAYLSGHDHNLQHLENSFNNHTVDFFVSGAANFIDTSLKHEGAVPSGSLQFHWADYQALGGFAHVKTTIDNMTMTFVTGTGKTLYSQTMLPRKL